MSKTSLLTSKILVPRRRRDILRRERLLSLLRSDPEDGQVVLIRAPAGFGKTTLLVDLAHDAVERIAWIALDEWDSDPHLLFDYFELAVRRAVDLPGSAEARRPADLKASLSRVLALIADSGRPLWLVFDDIHHLDAAPEALSLIDSLILHLPPGCRLFLTTRTSPPLRSLPRLRVQRVLIELGAEELAFTRDEIAQLYRERGAEITQERAEHLAAVTQGWPAGLVLMGDRADTEINSSMMEYLTAEIIDRLPEEVQQLLSAGSVLDALDEEACEAVLYRAGAGELLERLEHLNVPVFRTPGKLPQYRVHPLLRDFLRHKLRSGAPDVYCDLNLRAAAWLRSRGRGGEALRHLAAAGRWDEFGTLFEDEASAAYRLGRWHLVASWLKLVPAQELASRRGLRLWEIRILVRFGQGDDALRALSSLPASSSEPEAEILRATALRMKGAAADALESARAAVDLALKANSPIETVIEARTQLGLALCTAGSFAEAVPLLRAVLEFHEQRGDLEGAAFTGGVLGSALGAQGDLLESVRSLEHSRDQWKRLENLKELSWALNNLAVTYWRIGQTDLARTTLEECIAVARESGNERQEAYGLVSLGDVECFEGDLSRSIQLYEDARSIAVGQGAYGLLTYIVTGLSNAHRKAARYDRAEILGREALALAEDRGGKYEKGLALLAIGRLSRAQSRLDDAISALNEAVVLFEQSGSRKELAEALYWLADAALPLRYGRSLFRLTTERLAKVLTELGYDDFILRAATENPAPLQQAATRRYATGYYRGYYRSLVRRLPGSARSQADGDHEVGPSHPGLPRLEVTSLGGLEIRMDGRLVQPFEWESETSREVFLFLLVRDQPLSRDEILAALWPDLGPRKGKNLFHTSLHRIRKALYTECVVESAGRYAVNPDAIFYFDFGQLSHLLHEARRTNMADPRYIETLREIVALYAGPFAPSITSDWAAERRMRAEEQFLLLADRLMALLLKQQGYHEALTVAEKILANDPYNDAAVACEMRATVALGDPAEALRIFQRHSDLLQRDLGEAPPGSLVRLYRQIESTSQGGVSRSSM